MSFLPFSSHQTMVQHQRDGRSQFLCSSFFSHFGNDHSSEKELKIRSRWSKSATVAKSWKVSTWRYLHVNLMLPEVQGTYVFVWTWLSDQPVSPCIRSSLIPSSVDHGNLVQQHRGRSSQARERNGSIYISSHTQEALLFPSATVPALTNFGRAFLPAYFTGSKFFCQGGVKKTDGDGQGV